MPEQHVRDEPSRLSTLSRVLFDLYDQASRRPLESLRTYALERVSLVVPFDSAAWATGIVSFGAGAGEYFIAPMAAPDITAPRTKPASPQTGADLTSVTALLPRTDLCRSGLRLHGAPQLHQPHASKLNPQRKLLIKTVVKTGLVRPASRVTLRLA